MILFETDLFVIIITFKSLNNKTGDMAQVWILNKQYDPVIAVKNGSNKIICFDCKHRLNRSCYVNVGQAPLSVYKAYKNGLYQPLNYDVLKFQLKHKYVRFGAYGEPVLIPIELVQFIAQNSKGYTGYTHQWSDSKYAEYKHYLMASVDTTEEYESATLDGWRCYRVSSNNQPLKGEIICPNTTDNIQCRDCHLCDGLNNHPNAKNIATLVHGTVGKINAFNRISIATI
jgi:hypothetical protein